MASKNIQIRSKNGASWDDLFPKTKAAIVILDDGATTLSNKLSALDTSMSGKVGMTEVNNAIASVINSAPAALDTLDELAAALGDDANFASSVTTSLASKAPIASPTFTGTVSGITKSMVGLSNVDNTSDASKPVSTAQQTALNLKAPLANPTFTGTVNGISKSMVGLGNVDNTADASKPVSTAQATAIALVTPVVSPTEPTTTNFWYQEI
jgi:hypothetical protein